MSMGNAEFVLDAGGAPKVVAGAGHKSRIAVRSNSAGEAEELEAKKEEKHNLEGGLFRSCIEDHQFRCFFNTNEYISAAC